ncbi:hypothetical protein HDC30_002444 [Pseudomonas sp. JAI115]|nr:hypothetical protein [Pseudomonas sp. JAI115]
MPIRDFRRGLGRGSPFHSLLPEAHGIKWLESGNYTLSIPYWSDEELDKAVYDLLTVVSQQVKMRNCLSRRMPRRKAPSVAGRA